MNKGGLILEGGANRGIFTAGVLDCLMEEQTMFSYVAGVSAGSCNGVDYVSWQPGRTKECILKWNEKQGLHRLEILKENHSLFDMNRLFDGFPNSEVPFDFDAYFQSEMKMEVVVTNCLSGKAEYLQEKNDHARLMQLCRASSSMPGISPMVTIDGIPYLDGGIADSIPLLRSMKLGNRKNVVILTRNYGYRKKVSKQSNRFYSFYFKKYPNLAKTLAMRPIVYNQMMDRIEKWEKEGKIFVIRPTIAAISRLESDVDKLNGFFQNGYDTMKLQFSSMLDYLQNTN